MTNLAGKNSLVLALMTLLTALLWAGTSIYRSLTNSTIDPVTAQQTKTLNTTINSEIIELLRQKKTFLPEELDFRQVNDEQSSVASSSGENGNENKPE